jgi:hypothetical protein
MKPSRLFSLFLAGSFCSITFAGPPRLKVSENKHFLVTVTDAPFFWLGDTRVQDYALSTSAIPTG